MDAKEFVREKKRMCEIYTLCMGCPIVEGIDTCPEDSEEIVDAVENWSKTHPVVRNKDVFEDVFKIDYIPTSSDPWWNEPYKE